MSLKDKNIVVTGGSRGLGLGLVEALVERGAKVTVVARNRETLAAARERLGVTVISADVTDEAAAHRILGAIDRFRDSEHADDIAILSVARAPVAAASPLS